MSNLTFDQMALEVVAANRLLMRAILAHLVLSDSERSEPVIRSLTGAINAMATGAIKVPDMDPATRVRAIELVRQRARAFLDDFSLAPAASEQQAA